MISFVFVNAMFYLLEERVMQTRSGIRGSMVVRLTPDEKVACSIHIGFISRYKDLVL